MGDLHQHVTTRELHNEKFRLFYLTLDITRLMTKERLRRVGRVTSTGHLRNALKTFLIYVRMDREILQVADYEIQQ